MLPRPPQNRARAHTARTPFSPLPLTSGSSALAARTLLTAAIATMQHALRAPAGAALAPRRAAAAGLSTFRARRASVRVFAWGEPVSFRKASLAGNSSATPDGGLRTLLLRLPEDAARTFTYPGQYVQIKPSAPEDAKPAYIALASSPADVANNAGVVELLVKPQPGATAEVLCGLGEGDEVLVSDAQGKGFPLDRCPADKFPTVLLFATGSGISPIRSLIESGALKGRKDVRLYFGTRSPQHTAYADLASGSWAAEHGVKVTHVYSEGEGGRYVQDAFAAAGGIGALEGVDASKTCVVLVGQKQMSEALKEALGAAGVSAEAFLSNF